MARPWEHIIPYEDRSAQWYTTRWRLAGVATAEGEENTDSGVLYVTETASGDTVTVTVYKNFACTSSVMTGTVSKAAVDYTGENAIACTLSAANSSGMSGSFYLHGWEGNTASGKPIPLVVALCTDEDLDALWDGLESLPGYDPVTGCAEYIRVAQEDVLGKVASIFADRLGGYGAAEAWFILDAERSVPDLRRIANPAQLRTACAHHALEIALGRSHQAADPTMYSQLRDYHAAEYERALAALVLAVKAGSGDNAVARQSASVIRQVRA